jgi:diketogulonate reductase-like aldo/keto reductase
MPANNEGVNMIDSFGRAMENGVDSGKCRAIGLSDISLNELLPIYEAARIKPAVVQVEAHPYLPETELLEFCKKNDVVFLAFAPLGHGLRRAVQRGTALRTTPMTGPERGRISISPLFRKTRLTKSTEFKLDKGSMKS